MEKQRVKSEIRQSFHSLGRAPPLKNRAGVPPAVNVNLLFIVFETISFVHYDRGSSASFAFCQSSFVHLACASVARFVARYFLFSAHLSSHESAELCLLPCRAN